jgi:two-component system sensor histidine kinase GlrK
VAVSRARHGRHRAHARHRLRDADRATDSPGGSRDPADGHRRTSPTASKSTGPEDLRYLGQRLEWLRSRLSDLEEQQNRFLRHVSHELKTPLTAVREGRSCCATTSAASFRPSSARSSRIVRQNTLSLQKLIEDLLTYHQTRAMEPQAAGPVAMQDVVQRVLNEHKLAALARMVTFDQALAPAPIVGDFERVRTIVDNLVSNAIKYSPRSASSSCRCAPSRASRCWTSSTAVRASIRPSANGSSNRSTRAARPVDGRVKGSGLGLASPASTHSRTAAESSWSSRGPMIRGAHFRLWLPLATGDAEGYGTAAATQVRMAGGG